MQLTKSNASGVTVLVIQGSLDGTTSPQLEAELQGPIQAKEARVVLDFAQVPLVSSAALRVLLSAAKRMKKHGGRLRLCALRPEVKQVFDISDLTAFFDILPDQAAALDAVGSAPVAIPSAAPSPVAPATPAPVPVPVPAQPPPDAESSDAAATIISSRVRPPQPATPAGAPPPPAPAAVAPPPPTAPKVAPPPPPAAAPEDADPGATMVFPSSLRRRPGPAPSAAPATESPSPVVARSASAVPPVPAVNEPPAPPPFPSATQPSIPPVNAPANLPPPPMPVAPAAPLRRTAPAVLAKAAAVSEQPPSAPPLPSPATSVPSSSGAAVQTQGNEPRASTPPDDDQPRFRLPILAAIVVAAAALAWLGLHLLGGNKRDPDQTARATPSPTASPVIKVAPTPTFTPTRETAAASPSPSAAVISTPPPTPVAVAVTTPPPRSETPPPTPTPTPTLTPTPSPSPAGTKDGVASSAGPIDTNRTNPENQAVREAVLNRINAMPLPQADKDRLYMALDRARGLGKLVTVSFPNGRTNVSANDVASLNTALHRPATQRFIDDPSVVLVVLGFADVKGNDKANKDVSELRARRVVEALRGPCNVANMIHSLGMGGQSLAGETLEKNRVVEVWAVLP